MSVPDVSKLSVRELLATHSIVMKALRLHGVLRTENNPTGDYAEWLVSQKLNLNLEINNAVGYDALDSEGNRYQIKGRRVATQLGIIRNLDNKDFDFLVAVIFEENWDVRHSAKIPHGAIESLARYSAHQNGHIMHLNNNILANNPDFNIKHLLED